MILAFPEHREKSYFNNYGLYGEFDRMNQSIVVTCKKEDNPIRQQLFRMSAEANRLSELAQKSLTQELKNPNILAASQIFVDMERLMKGKELMYYSE